MQQRRLKYNRGAWTIKTQEGGRGTMGSSMDWAMIHMGGEERRHGLELCLMLRFLQLGVGQVHAR